MFEERLLTIEDDPEIARLIEFTGREAGFSTCVLTQSSSLPEIYRSFRPDVIVLDVLMPEFDGFEVIDFLKKQNCRQPIILLSGSEYRLMAERLARAAGLNVAANIAKPFRVAELRLALQELRMMVGDEHSIAANY